MKKEKKKRVKKPLRAHRRRYANHRLCPSSGDIILAGIVDGDINCRNLVVENNATLTGSLNTTEAVIAGNVKGDVVSDRVQILDTAHFEGDLKCSGIEVEAGAHVAARFNKRRKSKSSG